MSQELLQQTLDLAYVKGVAKAALTNHAAKETP